MYACPGYESSSVDLCEWQGKEFLCEKKAAMISGTIKNMLTGPGISWNPLLRSPDVLEGDFAEKEMGEITFPEIDGEVLEKVMDYFHYKIRYTNVGWDPAES